MEKQSEKAKEYLKYRERLKTLDVNMFLVENKNQKEQLEEAGKNLLIATESLSESKNNYEKAKEEYEISRRNLNFSMRR